MSTAANACRYEWGAPNHPAGADTSPDETSQSQVSAKQYRYATNAAGVQTSAHSLLHHIGMHRPSQPCLAFAVYSRTVAQVGLDVLCLFVHSAQAAAQSY